MAKILVIDDEENIRFTFKGFLLDEGHEVMTACDYNEAMAKVSETKFDLIFVDILLEGKSGMEVLREIHASKRNSSVVMITGVPDVETASEAVRLGAFDYVCKPIMQEKLLNITEKTLLRKTLADEKEKNRL